MTVSAASDADAVVDDAVTVTHAVSSTGDYSGETASDVAVLITETDTATLSIDDVSADEDAGDDDVHGAFERGDRPGRDGGVVNR